MRSQDFIWAKNLGGEKGEVKLEVMGHLGGQREWVWEVDVPPPAKSTWRKRIS